jgi:hypothetical protein
MRLACAVLVFYCVTAAAQSNPVPFVSQALVPASIQPGSSTFTLTVNGTGFAPTAVVNWNGSSRLTAAISHSQLKATINASDVAKARTASITVTNPSPGGGISNVVFFPIRKPNPEVAMAGTQIFPNATAVVVGDFNNDGKLDVAWSDSHLNVSLGNGKGGFLSPIVTNLPGGVEMLAADFNGDGKLDIAETDGHNVNIFLGNGDGTFTQSWFFQTRGGGNHIAVADFNLDGHLDLYITEWDLGHQWFEFFLGQGDGTFIAGQTYFNSYFAEFPAVGDFNGDARLDLAVPDGGGGVHIFLGQADGSFHEIGTAADSLFFVASADMNRDGKLDLVGDQGCIVLGNGDGSFTPQQCAGYQGFPTIGDFNGDGILDTALLNSSYPSSVAAILLGAGDGTFSSSFVFSAGPQTGVPFAGAIGDFNNDGMLDVIGSNGFLLLQTTASLSPTSLAFGSLNVGTTSLSQTVTLKNIGLSALVINQISIAGTGSSYFAQTNDCGLNLAAGASCTITVTFSPRAGGTFTPSLRVSYVGAGSPQNVPLSGTGVTPPKVSLKPTSLTYATQLIGTISSAQTATLTNIGHQDVTISSISISGAFNETNNCPAILGVALSCQIQVTFQPSVAGTAHGTLLVNDNAIGNPHKVRLTGTGTVITFSPIGVNFGNQKVGTTSAAAPITLSNIGGSAVSITQIAITGTNPGDFAQTNDCGNSVPAHGSCTISVKFKPTAPGARSAAVSVTDNGGGSPQTVPLAGAGT